MITLPFMKPRKKSSSTALVAVGPAQTGGIFDAETQTVISSAGGAGEHLVVITISAIVFVAITMSAIVRLERVVTATGKVLAPGGALYVQPLDRSIVRQVLVRAGDVVKKGQTLATLDPTFAQADLTQYQQKRDSSAALVARLKAEQAGIPYIPAGLGPYEVLQLSIWRQRQQEYRQSILDFDAKLSAGETVIARSQKDVYNYSEKLKLATELEEMQTKLKEKGYGSRVQAIGAAQDRVEASRMLAESQSLITQTRHESASIAAQKAGYISKWRDDIGAQLVQAQNDLDQAEQFLSKANKQQDLTTLTAPEDAVVLEVGNASKGSVVDSNGVSKPLFTLTPLKGAAEADIEIRGQDIGFLKKGDKARIKLDAYKFTSHGTADAEIETISEGSFTANESGQIVPAYFKARIRFTQVNLRNVPKDFRLVPGMTLQADILVGRRTVLSYILEGAIRTGSEAMREPQ